jgi:hypothetical protein
MVPVRFVSEALGKDEVSGSNPDSSSIETSLFFGKGWFSFAFRNFFGVLETGDLGLTT